MRQRKIRLDRGDTLGGTVPLLMRDRVTAESKPGLIHRRRSDTRFGVKRARGRGGFWKSALSVTVVSLFFGFLYALFFDPVLLAAITEIAWDAFLILFPMDF